MRFPDSIGLGLAILACGTLAGCSDPPPQPPKTQQTVPSPQVAFEGTVTPGVHLLSGLGPSAAYLIESSQGLALIDCGVEPECRELERQVRALGLDLSRLKAVLITHGHGDHTLGAAHLRETTGAKVYAGKGDCPVLRAGGPFKSLFSLFPEREMRGVTIRPLEVDVELTGDEVLDLGDVRIKAIATPGHTPGSMCYVLEGRDGPRVFFGGDTIVSFQQFGTYQLHIAPHYGGNAGDFLTSLKKLQKLPAPDLLLPGHPDEFIRQDPTSAVITPGDWRALLARGVMEVNRLMMRQQADGADFLDDLPKQILPGVYSLGELGARAVYCLSTPAGPVLFDAPGPGLVEFLRDRASQVSLDVSTISAVMLTSCDPDAITGLNELLAELPCTVVASKERLASLRDSCPPDTILLAAEELSTTKWSEVEAMPLPGRGRGPTAYRVNIEDKSVLLSGRLPLRLTSSLPAPALSQIIGELKQDFATGEGDAKTYLASLKSLDSLRPHVWLPAKPLGGQNANLYGREWSDVISSNEKLVRGMLAHPQ